MKKQKNNMNSAKDYEQLYYDEVYKNKKLINKCKYLEEENNLYKELLKNKPLKILLANALLEYERSKDANKN